MYKSFLAKSMIKAESTNKAFCYKYFDIYGGIPLEYISSMNLKE